MPPSGGHRTRRRAYGHSAPLIMLKSVQSDVDFYILFVQLCLKSLEYMRFFGSFRDKTDLDAFFMEIHAFYAPLSPVGAMAAPIMG